MSVKPLKASPKRAPSVMNSQDTTVTGNSNGSTSYDSIEDIFLTNLGNWKKLKRQDNKDIYKCSECD